VNSALDELGSPHQGYPTLHVGGTNGKGSVAATLAAVLSAGHLRTGLYTSPHLCSFQERFQISGRPVAEARLVAAADSIREVIVRHGLTSFEAATVLGLHLFAREQVEAAVLEVGLGGRLDATNVVRPDVSVVTNVAMDHAEFLGDTRDLIAAEKAGIAKEGVPFVTAETDPAVLDVFGAICAERGAPLHVLAPGDMRDVDVAADHTTFTLVTRGWGELRITTPLVGAHQAVNAALAVEALEHATVELRPSARAVVAGVAGVSWSGRDQIEEIGGRTWLFDVAHNSAGVGSLVDVLDRIDLPRPWVAIIGVLGDREWRDMLPPVLQRVDRAILTRPPSALPERCWDTTEAAEAVGALLPAGYPLTTEPDFSDALDRARGGPPGGTVIVTGSCRTVGDALKRLNRCPFRG
jgi:dihydrofolate synthase/folylpolyglutamate synthase